MNFARRVKVIMGYTFMVPAKIISGVNVIAELGDHIAGKGSYRY